MKKLLLVLTFVTASATLHMSSFAGSSFNRRWGANSHITNIPLFFKQHYYDQNTGDCNGCQKQTRRGQQKVYAPKTVRTSQPKRARRTKNIETIVVQNQKPAIIQQVKEMKAEQVESKPTVARSDRNTRKTNRTLANAHYETMRQKQKELEAEKIRLERELVDLEKKKFDVHVVKS